LQPPLVSVSTVSLLSTFSTCTVCNPSYTAAQVDSVAGMRFRVTGFQCLGFASPTFDLKRTVGKGTIT